MIRIAISEWPDDKPMTEEYRLHHMVFEDGILVSDHTTEEDRSRIKASFLLALDALGAFPTLTAPERAKQDWARLAQRGET